MRFLNERISIILLGVLLSSCDPAQEIVLINNSNSGTTVQFYLEPHSENYVLNEYANDNVLIFLLKPIDTVAIHFGIGTWVEEEINVLAQDIHQLKVENDYKLKVYKSKKELRKFFSAAREKSWMKATIYKQVDE